MASNTSGNAFKFPTASDHPAGGPSRAPRTEDPTEDALDHGIEESFPASDPVSVSVTKLAHVRSDDESAAGEEDPGASLDLPQAQPGDEAAPGTQGAGEGICRQCGGTGRVDQGEPCPSCSGTGKVTVGIGGA